MNFFSSIMDMKSILIKFSTWPTFYKRMLFVLAYFRVCSVQYLFQDFLVQYYYILALIALVIIISTRPVSVYSHLCLFCRIL